MKANKNSKIEDIASVSWQDIDLLKQLPNDIKHQMRCVLKGITYESWLSSDILPVYKKARKQLSKEALLKTLK